MSNIQCWISRYLSAYTTCRCYHCIVIVIVIATVFIVA